MKHARMNILGRAFNIALKPGLTEAEKSKTAADIARIRGITITDRSSLYTDGYRTPSRYITAPAEGCHLGGQFSGSNEEHDEVSREIERMPGVMRLRWH